MKDIKAIIFDWGGVFCKEGEPFASRALQLKLSLDPNQIAQEVKDIYAGYYVGRYGRDTFWHAIMRHWYDHGQFDLYAATKDMKTAKSVHDCIGRTLASSIIDAARLDPHGGHTSQ